MKKYTEHSVSRRDAIQLAMASVAVASAPSTAGGSTALAGGPVITLMCGEPKSDSILLQARFAHSIPDPGDAHGVSPGLEGSAYFEVSLAGSNAVSVRSPWIPVVEANDCIARAAISGLRPGTRYTYRALFKRAGSEKQILSRKGAFTTFQMPDGTAPVSLTVLSCMSYELFFGLGQPRGRVGPWRAPAAGIARQRGYPAMDLIAKSDVQFIVATGDTVYYDHPASDQSLWARTKAEMRAKWHRQFALTAVSDAFASRPAFFMKDDHDFRFDDGDNAKAGMPTPKDGHDIFLEQVPIVTAQPAQTYRTRRVNKFLQIWLIEGRDFRSDNEAADGASKTMWGNEQRQWLESTLVESDAQFKLVISPTPIVGPDDAQKHDNQTTHGGFRTEGQSFLHFLRDKGLVDNTFIINGDRHWKYHSIDPTGVEEFSCGTVHRQNSRFGVVSGDPQGSDPAKTIIQPYLQPLPDGGFITVNIDPNADGTEATMFVQFFGEDGLVQYAVRRLGKRGRPTWDRPAS